MGRLGKREMQYLVLLNLKINLQPQVFFQENWFLLYTLSSESSEAEHMSYIHLLYSPLHLEMWPHIQLSYFDYLSQKNYY